MRINISFIPRSLLNSKLSRLSNSEIENPYLHSGEDRESVKFSSEYIKHRSNYLNLKKYLSEFAEAQIKSNNEALAERCIKYLNEIDDELGVRHN
jgi:hypothetical protein